MNPCFVAIIVILIKLSYQNYNALLEEKNALIIYLLNVVYIEHPTHANGYN
jgi:hypothetical protein